MGKKIEFSKEQIQQIIDLYNGGFSTIKIAEIFNCSKHTINRILTSSEIPKKDAHDQFYSKTPDTEVESIISMYKNGYTQSEVAKYYGVSTSRINRILKKYNIEKQNVLIKKSEYKTIVELYVSGRSSVQIAKQYNVTSGTIRDILNKCNVKRKSPEEYNRKYYFDEHYFDIIDSRNKAYIMGLLYADGCNLANDNGVTLKLQEKDKEILEKINKELKNEKPLSFYEMSRKNQNWQNTYSIELYSEHLTETLTSKGLIPCKSLVLTFPDWLDRNFYADFIRGYMDGDGCISKDITRASVNIVGTEEFCKSLANIFKEELNLDKYHIYFPSASEPGKNTRVLAIYGFNRVVDVLNYIYKDAELYIQRKYDIYKSIYCNHTKIVA